MIIDTGLSESNEETDTGLSESNEETKKFESAAKTVVVYNSIEEFQNRPADQLTSSHAAVVNLRDNISWKPKDDEAFRIFRVTTCQPKTFGTSDEFLYFLPLGVSVPTSVILKRGNSRCRFSGWR